MQQDHGHYIKLELMLGKLGFMETMTTAVCSSLAHISGHIVAGNDHSCL